MEYDSKTSSRIAMRVSWASIVGNVLLSLFKLFAGIVAHSGAMLSDAVHSMSDVASTLVVMVGIHMAHQDSDKQHPYGHERLESVAAIVLSVLLFATGVGIGYGGIQLIFRTGGAGLAVPGLLALVAAVVSIVVKEYMYQVTKRAAQRIGSDALMADAWHHRSDALSSIGSFVGILGARLGLPVLDPVASVVICVFILKAALQIFFGAIRKMTDEACDPQTEADMRAFIAAQEGVLGIDKLTTRMFGNRVYMDVEISLHGEETLTATHDIAERVHDAIEVAFPCVKHCMIHVNPAGEGAEGGPPVN